MSLFTRYLNQVATLERVTLGVDGKPLMDAYGELVYKAAVTIRCKRDKYTRDVQMPSGAIVKSSTKYITDAEVGMNDRLDGRAIMDLEEYTNPRGDIEAYGSIT